MENCNLETLQRDYLAILWWGVFAEHSAIISIAMLLQISLPFISGFMQACASNYNGFCICHVMKSIWPHPQKMPYMHSKYGQFFGSRIKFVGKVALLTITYPHVFRGENRGGCRGLWHLPSYKYSGFCWAVEGFAGRQGQFYHSAATT